MQGDSTRPVCGECEGSGIEPCVCVADCPHGDCPSCDGDGYDHGRDATEDPYDPILDALDGGQE